MEQIKISKIEAIPVCIQAVPFATSYGAYSEYKNVIVKTYDNTGRCGVGEAPPWLPVEMGETQETVITIIEKCLKPALLGVDPREIDKVHDVMDFAVRGHVIAKAAIDMALYDLNGKIYSVPVSTLLGGAYRKEIENMGPIGINSVSAMVKEAEEWVKQGRRVIKMKLPGVNVEEPGKSVERAIKIREVVGPEIVIIVDINQGWVNVANALRGIRRLEAYNIYVEQPILANDFNGMAELTRLTNCPIIADESVFTFDGLLSIIKLGAPHIINVKVTRSGGLYKALQIIRTAEAAGILVQVDDVVESRIAVTASAHLAACVHPDKFFCYSGGCAHEFAKQDIVKGGGVTIKDGKVYTSNQPGLGLELDEEMIREITCKVP